MNKLYDSLLLKGYSKEAAIFLAEKFPESTAEAIYEVATEGSKEELMELCSTDSYLYDENIGTYLEVTWDYIEKNYEVLELSNGKFVLICSHKQ